MIEKSYPVSPQAARAFPWPLRAVSAATDLAEALRELAAAQDTIANLQALNASLARSLNEAHEQKAPALASPLEGVIYRALGTTELGKVAARLKELHDAEAREHFAIHAAIKATPADIPPPAPKTYRPKCRTCGLNFEDPSQYAKKCPTCEAASATPKPARPGLTSNKAKAQKTQPRATKAAKPSPPDDEDEKDAPIVPQRPTIACAGCNHAKRNTASETGWECTISRYRDCMPWTYAHLKSATPSTPAR